MENPQTVCLLNDSFPPLIDGVANTVLNYANHLQNSPFQPVVITPSHPDAKDDAFPYPVLRYPSIQATRFEGYPAGIPFSPEIPRFLDGRNVSILHTHCPIMSTFMARQLRQITGAPLVLTYHTKFDIDIEHVIHTKPLQLAAKKALVANISACDEVWAVSRGAGENLRSLGYEGDYVIMPNGVDMPCTPASDALVSAATGEYDLPEGVPVYLFVGRMMWYKGLKIIADALTALHARNQDFRMVWIGTGDDFQEIREYAVSCGIEKQCIFTGAIHDRELLRGWYTRADLFLFPSTFDTNGLVVREAASCDLASVLIRGSCAAEGVTDGRNGFLIGENPESLVALLLTVSRETCKEVGHCAARELYLSWEDAVKLARERYNVILEKQKQGAYLPHREPIEGMMKINGELMDALAKVSAHRRRRMQL